MLVRQAGHALGQKIADGGIPLPKHHHAVRVAKREGAQKNRVQHAEHSGIGADPQRQYDDGDGYESGIISKTTQGELQVRKHALLYVSGGI